MRIFLRDVPPGKTAGSGHARPAAAPLQRSCGSPAAMPDWRIIPAGPEHIPPIAAAMRETDRREVAASHGHTPREALENALGLSSLAWTCIVNGAPGFMWGVAGSGFPPGTRGAPWLLATGAIRCVERELLRRCRGFVAEMLRVFPRLENYVHAENVRSRRWLAWCGFRTAPAPEPYGVAGELFYHFWKGEASHV